jgi:hypothetical protein
MAVSTFEVRPYVVRPNRPSSLRRLWPGVLPSTAQEMGPEVVSRS